MQEIRVKPPISCIYIDPFLHQSPFILYKKYVFDHKKTVPFPTTVFHKNIHKKIHPQGV